MRNAGKKYPLLIYTRMMDRWWPPIFLIGAAMLALAWWRYTDLFTRLTQPWQWMTLAGAGGLCVFAALVMLLLRQSAYVRPYSDHLLLATPLLRMRISYKRIKQTSTAAMSALFPPSKMSFLTRDTAQPLLHMTAVILDLNSLPMPRPTLRLFLSPFFFRDQTPHIVLLVRNWMAFSSELDSRRAIRNVPASMDRASHPSGILSQLPRK